MTLDEYNAFCHALPATTYVVQWHHSHVWKIGGKVFAIGSLNREGQPAFTFKTSVLNFDFLSEHPGYRPAPYFASRGMKWIQHDHSTAETDEALRYYLTESYRIVSLGLSQRMQRALGLNQSPSS
ncbi:MmcQ/YjbR family DNA-binding protein [Vibrio rhizosphaerae]|uniref:MmcQ/YjbR family DNA-binding protein n=1 Tax=Vibrio rhizosphaerae TaxID=398736 RepID=UPI00056E3AB3|nr:MmcQ/YjbR family DNA-binding protein [Vibrio rhizosphaerae]